MNPKLSIVVPVYNSLPYLEKCISSIVEQDCEPGELELLLMDDGSNDGSEKLMDEAAAKYDCVTVVHGENSGGPVVPRNNGLAIAKGSYVFFVDSDDWIYPGSVRGIIGALEEHPCDILLVKIDGQDWDNDYFGIFEKSAYDCTVSNSPIVNSLSVAKVFNTEFIRNCGIEFSKGYREDLRFSMESYFKTDKIGIYADQFVYRYVKRADESSRSYTKISPEACLEASSKYLETASKYSDVLTNPHMFHRPFRNFSDWTELSSVLLDDAVVADAFGKMKQIFETYDCDGLRSCMNLSTLAFCEAVAKGESVKKTQAIPTLAYSQSNVKIVGSGEGNLGYQIIDPDSGEVLIEALFPKACEQTRFFCRHGYEPEPGKQTMRDRTFLTNTITSAKLDEDAMRFEGTIELNCECSTDEPKVFLRVQDQYADIKTCSGGNPDGSEFELYESPRLFNREATIVDCNIEQLSDLVRRYTIKWKAEMELDELSKFDFIKNDCARWNTYLDVQFEHKTVRNRFGKDIVKGVFSEWVKQIVCVGDKAFMATKTEFGNLQVKMLDAKYASGQSAKLSIATQKKMMALKLVGATNVDNALATKIVLSLEPIDSNRPAITATAVMGEAVSLDDCYKTLKRSATISIENTARRGMKSYWSYVNLSEVPAGQYRCKLEIRFAGASIEIPCEIAGTTSANIKKSSATLRSEQDGTVLVIE